MFQQVYGFKIMDITCQLFSEKNDIQPRVFVNTSTGDILKKTKADSTLRGDDDSLFYSLST